MNAYQDWVLKIREGKVGCANPIHKKTTTDDDSEFLTCAVAEMDGFLDNVTPQKSNKRKRGIQPTNAVSIGGQKWEIRSGSSWRAK
ncbi:hypothetical protein ACFXTH_025735 [Malus domestica]